MPRYRSIVPATILRPRAIMSTADPHPQPGDGRQPLGLWAQAALIALASLLYLTLPVTIFGEPFLGPDGAAFMQLGETLRIHRTLALTPTSPPMFDRVPIYPLFIALCQQLGAGEPSVDNVVAGQIVVTAMTSVCIGGIAAMVVGPEWALAAGCMYTVYRGTIYTVSFITRESLSAVFLYGALFCCLRARRSIAEGFVTATLAGLLFGVGALCREELAAYAVIGLLYVAGAPWQTTSRDNGRKAILFLAALVVAMSPWIARNYIQARRFLPLSTAAGTELYAGNNPDVQTHGIDYGLAPRLREQSTLDPFSTNQQYRRLALQFISDHPRVTIGNWLTKMRVYLWPHQKTLGAYFFCVSFGLLVYYAALRVRCRRPDVIVAAAVSLLVAGVVALAFLFPPIIMSVTGNYMSLLPLGLAGLFLGRRSIDMHWLLLAVYGVGIVIAAVIIPQYRQRFVLDGVWCVYACFALGTACKWVRALAERMYGKDGGNNVVA